MTKLDSAKLDSSAKPAETCGVARVEAADRASAGPRPRWQVYDVAGAPLMLALTRPDAATVTAELAPFAAIDLAVRLLEAARRRLARS